MKTPAPPPHATHETAAPRAGAAQDERTRRRRAPGVCAAALAAAVLALSWAASPATAAESENADVARPAKKQKDKSLLDLYWQGGWLMHPIALCSLGTVATGLYAGLLTGRRRLSAPHLAPHLHHAVAHRRVNEAYDTCRRNAGLLTDALGAALAKADLSRDPANRAAMDQAAADSLAQEETRCMYWINYLNVFATIAPMLGLLGTVTGMIQSFDQLAAGKTEPQDLAGGISEAMITTAGGLFVGIPAMLLYLLFRNNLQSAVTDAQRAITLMLDLLGGDTAHGDDEPEPFARDAGEAAEPALQ